ncbi:MAG TPA: PEGA domain-containing protein [Spirochaetota bacterium]|nr:PEGA domain-containing protein [Spirochaetota bacterium]HOM37587.1 PEGA domain-containing protein [Spirochaetota bacterium]HPQ49442.1 PEGA domain-containing protein [Spirochaetota bacterium]
MENKKIIISLLLPIFISSCFLTEKKVKKIDFEKPEFKLEKKIIISKFESDGTIELKILSEYLPELLYTYLKHIDKIPFIIDIATIKNNSFFTKFGYKPEKLSQREKIKLIKYGILSDNFSLYLYPLFLRPDEIDDKNIKFPESFKIKTEKFRENEKYSEDILFLTGNIRKDGINVKIYDPYTEKTIFEWEEKTKIDLTKIDIEKIDLNFIKPIVLSIMKKLINNLTKDEYYLLEIENTEGAIIYIDEQYINTDAIYINKGKHILKAIKDNYKTKKLELEINNDTKIKIEMEKNEEKEITVNSSPNGAALFLDDLFIGFTPVSFKVIKNKTYNIRLSLEGFEHYNLNFNTKNQENNNIKIILKKYNYEVEEKKKTINKIKNFTFYSFFPFFAGFIYTKERADYYQSKFETIQSMEVSQWSKYNINQVYDRAIFFNNAQQFFKNTSIIMLITAGILQLLELEMDDVGVGVDQDKNLGIFYKW